MTEKSTLKWGPKQLLNCGKPNETRAFMSIPRNRGPGELPEKPATGMPINRGLKNPKRYKRASWVGDGLNTVREVEVRHTANLKSREP